MRIGIDGGCWLNRRGYGRYTRGLLSALARHDSNDEYFIFVDRETARTPDLPMRFQKVIVSTSQPPATAASAAGHRIIRDLCRMSWAVARSPLDVFFFPSVYTFFPLFRPLRAIVVIHDVIAEHYPDMVLGRRSLALLWRLKLDLAIWQAPVILTVSDYARRGIIDHFGLAPERVRTVHEAPDPIFRPLVAPRNPADLLPGCKLPRDQGRYLLYVGGLSPHKNLHLLIEAFQRLLVHGELHNLRLLIVGDYQADVFRSAYQSLRQEVHQKRLEDRVCFTGYVPDEVLVDLYNLADLLILPSLEEGFGLPAFEAAACGTPVVTSSAGPAASLLGPAALAFPPNDLQVLTEGLRHLLGDPARRRAMGEAGRERARSFSWEQAAAQTHMALLEVGSS